MPSRSFTAAILGPCLAMALGFAPASGQKGDWKAVAYSEEGEYLLAFTMDARSKAAFDKNLPVFSTLIRRYAKDIPW